MILSGMATGALWLCYYKALQIGEASVAVPVPDTERIRFTTIRICLTQKGLAR